MTRTIRIGDRIVGDGQPVYIAAEIGINHNGDLDIARQLIDVAGRVGCDAVKFQKRTPEVCVPPEQRDRMRSTPWGEITYLEYRKRMEFGAAEYGAIDEHCRHEGIAWFASPWDEESVRFLDAFDPPAYKIASATLTNEALLKSVRSTGRTVILSTGMSSLDQIDHAVELLGTDDLLITHCTSSYPCAPDELNLRMIETLRNRYSSPIGYSGHEVGLPTTVVAVALGACYVERHITLDRAMWGSDHAASVEPGGFERLVNYIRVTEAALGDGEKRVYESEQPLLERLRHDRR
ncbi:MAG: N-acetylneuraminate synthase family protein [Acidimicrobiia bacterium]